MVKNNSPPSLPPPVYLTSRIQFSGTFKGAHLSVKLHFSQVKTYMLKKSMNPLFVHPFSNTSTPVLATDLGRS